MPRCSLSLCYTSRIRMINNSMIGPFSLDINGNDPRRIKALQISNSYFSVIPRDIEINAIYFHCFSIRSFDISHSEI